MYLGLTRPAINPGAELVDSFPVLDYLPHYFRKSQIEGDKRFQADVAWSMERYHVSYSP